MTAQGDVDAIVSTIPANLEAAGSLNRAVFAGAGPELDGFILEHIYKPRSGEVYAVPGFNLPVSHVLYVITPEWRTGQNLEDRDLLRCYRGAVQAAREMGLKKIAFAAMGTGPKKYPLKRAARLGVQGIMDRIGADIEEVRIVCNRRETHDVFHDVLVHYGWSDRQGA